MADMHEVGVRGATAEAGSRLEWEGDRQGTDQELARDVQKATLPETVPRV